MNKYGYKCSPPSKRKPKKKCSNRKLGIIMLLLGALTILALFLPLDAGLFHIDDSAAVLKLLAPPFLSSHTSPFAYGR